MEKYFRIRRDSKFYKEYFQFVADTKRNAELFRAFAAERGIESHSFIPLKNGLYIVPTEKDIERFGGDFVKDTFKNGLRRFKKTSKVSKLWCELMKNEKVAERPRFWSYVPTLCGRFRERCIRVGDDLYGSLQSQESEIQLADFMDEIKASEFYLIMEQDAR